MVCSQRYFRIDETVSAIKQENPAANLRALELDQASFQAVRAAAAKINEYAEPIHVSSSPRRQPATERWC